MWATPPQTCFRRSRTIDRAARREVDLRFLVTGGAGFIGCNYVHRLLSRGERAVVYDDLSRAGVRANLDWLAAEHASALEVIAGDVCDLDGVRRAARDADVIVHLAGQTAVTTSVADPLADFRANALGALNVLEAARAAAREPIVLYASTNKVYGGMEVLGVVEQETRYAYRDLPFGIAESQPLDFHSPYGCSKGAADQYVRDYHRIYGVRTVVFRQSCIYGPRQMGCEDQGWLAWFMIAALAGRPLTVYGDGKQARDVLYVEDLLDAYDAAITHVERAAGQVYNVGGGPDRILSVWAEFAPALERLLGRRLEARRADWRPGDQRVYVSDVRKAKRDLGWAPKVSVEEGLTRLLAWIEANRHLFPAAAPE
ncbi:MAG: GDP-mannose 4,6-dehydratase [Candidatus Binatia bacterium]